MKDYYVSPLSTGISYAFINALCILTGDVSLNTPQPANTNLLRHKLLEVAQRHNFQIIMSTDAFCQNEINQIANHLIGNKIISESDFLKATEDFLTNNPNYAQLPPHLAGLRKPLC